MFIYQEKRLNLIHCRTRFSGCAAFEVLKMKFIKDEEAVSPVIGVILMVAITVILAAVIAAFVFGMTGQVQSSKSVGVTAQYFGGASSYIEITNQGGADDAKLLYLKVTLNQVTGYTAATSGTSTWIAQTAAGTPASDPFKPSVGAKYIASAGSSGVTFTLLDAGTNALTVVGHFTDGSDQVLLDKKV